MDAFDQIYSRFRSDSLVGTIAARAGRYQFPPDSEQLFTLYRQLYDCSDGLVTPLIGQVLADAGYDAEYSLRSRTLWEPPAWDEAMEYANGVLTTTRPLLLDFGAAGKGYLVDIVAALLEGHGIKKYCIDASGDMICRGMDAPLRIGLENPNNPTRVVGVTELRDGALCGSAGNRRAWGRYHHIINPQTLESPRHIEAVWVAADTALVADGLATALFFVPPDKLQERFQCSYVIIYAGGDIAHSDSFPTELLIRANAHA